MILPWHMCVLLNEHISIHSYMFKIFMLIELPNQKSLKTTKISEAKVNYIHLQVNRSYIA